MSSCPTVVIETAAGPVVINESDFNAKVHTLFKMTEEQIAAKAAAVEAEVKRLEEEALAEAVKLAKLAEANILAETARLKANAGDLQPPAVDVPKAPAVMANTTPIGWGGQAPAPGA